jgi:hypothetical protein
MASERARRRAPPFIDPPGYARHRPEATLLYELVERHYADRRCARSRRSTAAEIRARESHCSSPALITEARARGSVQVATGHGEVCQKARNDCAAPSLEGCRSRRGRHFRRALGLHAELIAGHPIKRTIRNFSLRALR